MSKLIREIECKMHDKEEAYAVIGAEIRLRRLSSYKTLKALAYKTCSVSYISKIESNDIIPNQFVLRELSKKLGMDERQFNNILALKDSITDIIKAIIKDDFSNLSNMVNQCNELLNYRAKIILFLYYTNTNNLKKAEELYKELIKISNSMNVFDFKAFVLGTSIYFFKIGDVNEAYLTLQELVKMELNNDLRCAIYIYLFQAANVLGKPEAINYYNSLKNQLLEIGSFELLDDMNYYLAIYYLKLNSYDYAMSLCPTIKNIKKRNSVKLLINYMKGESINNYSRKGVINMARCLYDYKCCEESLQSDFNECKKKGCLMIDFYPLIIEYLQLNDNIEKSDFISNKVLKELERSKDLFLRKYFTNQAWIISSTNAKYKFFFETYANFLGKE